MTQKLTIKQLAARLGVRPNTVQKWVRRGLPTAGHEERPHTPGVKPYLFDEEQVGEWFYHNERHYWRKLQQKVTDIVKDD